MKKLTVKRIAKALADDNYHINENSSRECNCDICKQVKQDCQDVYLQHETIIGIACQECIDKGYIEYNKNN